MSDELTQKERLIALLKDSRIFLGNIRLDYKYNPYMLKEIDELDQNYEQMIFELEDEG